MNELFKPGDKAPSTGDYNVVTALGTVVETGISMEKGETFPPTPKPGQYFVKAH